MAIWRTMVLPGSWAYVKVSIWSMLERVTSWCQNFRLRDNVDVFTFCLWSCCSFCFNASVLGVYDTLCVSRFPSLSGFAIYSNYIWQSLLLKANVVWQFALSEHIVFGVNPFLAAVRDMPTRKGRRYGHQPSSARSALLEPQPWRLAKDITKLRFVHVMRWPVLSQGCHERQVDNAQILSSLIFTFQLDAKDFRGPGGKERCRVAWI